MPDPFRVEVDAREVLGVVNALSKQAPFAMAIAMNRTAEDANAAGRQHARQVFTIREQQVVNWAFPIPIPSKERANKRKLAITMEPTRLGVLLEPFEAGKPHTADRLGRLPAVPTEALRPTPQTRIPRELYPVNVGLQVRLDPKGTLYFALGRGSKRKKLTPFRGGGVKVGRRGFYEIQTPEGLGLIFRRLPGEKRSTLAWVIRPVVRRPAVLDFISTISRTIDERFEANLLGAWEYAQATAK